MAGGPAAPHPVLPEVLVVDDDLEIGALIVGIAHSVGLKASSASSFVQLKKFSQIPRRIIVLDLHLPAVDGVEIIRFLARKRCVGGLILVSGAGDRVILAAKTLAEEQGLRVIGTLSKPFFPSDLRNLLLMPMIIGEPSLEAPIEALTEAELKQALAEEALELHYQPKISLKEQKVTGVEALARLRHPTRGLLPPSAFISLAESTGYIDQLTDQVCDLAIRDCEAWRSRGLTLAVAVNVSILSLQRLDFPDQLATRVLRSGVAIERFTVEVTESALTSEPVRALDVLTRLRLKGFGLSIDDFGTGYSTMRQLERIPFGELKLDRRFVRGAAEKPESEAIMASSVDLARRLKMQVVAEGVETIEDWDLITRIGCDEIQGYLVAPPMPIEELIPWVQAWKGIPAG